MNRTYVVITNENRIPVLTCQQILANKMQCWRPGAILIQETTPQEGGDALVHSYQLCKTHAIILEAAEKQATQAADVSEEAALNQMLGAQQQQEQTTTVQGEDSPNNQ